MYSHCLSINRFLVILYNSYALCFPTPGLTDSTGRFVYVKSDPLTYGNKLLCLIFVYTRRNPIHPFTHSLTDQWPDQTAGRRDMKFWLYTTFDGVLALEFYKYRISGLPRMKKNKIKTNCHYSRKFSFLRDCRVKRIKYGADIKVGGAFNFLRPSPGCEPNW